MQCAKGTVSEGLPKEEMVHVSAQVEGHRTGQRLLYADSNRNIP